MLKISALPAAAMMMAALTSQTLAYTFAGHPGCPWAEPSHTWAKFLNQEYGPGDAYFSIRFSRDVGDIQAGSCYTIAYHGNENWTGSGQVRDLDHSKAEDRHGGNPLNYQINVWGAAFTYNEAGEVFYVANGLLSGNMYCHLGSECWK